MRRTLCSIVTAASLVLVGVTAQAQTTATGGAPSTTDTQTTETMDPAPAQASTPADKLVARFSTFAGSEENAASLVNGLRTGSEITLTGSSSSGSASESATFTSPTKPTGYGNIRIALSLAEAKLGSEGITQPTPQQLQTALMGDMSGATAQSTSYSQGILQMRASGMGWGQIANEMGFKLGAVMSGRAPASTTAATSQPGDSATVTATGATAGVSSNGRSARASGIVTAGGRPAGGNNAHHSGTGRGRGSAASSSGIVTATGASAGGGSARNPHAFSAAGNANGHAAAAGSGGASSSGAVSAQGAGRGAGNAYGHSK